MALAGESRGKVQPEGKKESACSAIASALRARLAAIPPTPIPFLFSPGKPGSRSLRSLTALLEAEITALPGLLDRKERLGIARLLAGEPCGPGILPTLARLGSLHPDGASQVTRDLCIAWLLAPGPAQGRPLPAAPFAVELLHLYNRRIPELLILAGPLLGLILRGGEPAAQQAVRTRACALLINHFEIETLITTISFDDSFSEEQKQALFQSLTAFQKIYRKFLEVHEWIGNKDQISRKWFGMDFDALKKEAAFRDNISALVDRFLGLLRRRDAREALALGRFMVLRFNNEDILRLIHGKTGAPDGQGKPGFKRSIFRRIHAVMKEFRQEYISPRLDEELTRFIANLEVQNVEAMRQMIAGRAPQAIARRGAAGEDQSRPEYPLDIELAERLQRYNLMHLFDLCPLSPPAQQILSRVSLNAELLGLAKEQLVKFIFHLERLLIFLQQIEELRIPVVEGRRYGIIVNVFQMNSLSMIEEGAYFASTGCWLNTTTPPSVIRCINPRAIPNCLGILERHIFSRISLLTGAYCGAPFDLDSTNRYDWDEEPETCQIRPGYFLIGIPEPVRRAWERTQAFQRRTLQEKISAKTWG